MKKKVFYLALALFSLAVASCKDDGGDTEPGWTPAPQPDPKGWLLDGGSIRDMEFTCPPMHLPAYKGGGIVKLTDYSKLSLEVKIPSYGGISAYAPDDIKEWGAYSDFMRECFMERSAVIVKAYEEYGYKAIWPDMFSAYTYEDVSLTCDRTLFGQEPGTDLSPYFAINRVGPCSVVGAENMTFLYNFGEEPPTNMRDNFPVGVWLHHLYMIRPASVPEEKYDNLTFRLSIPVRREHSIEHFLSKYKGEEKPLRKSDVLLEADCEVEFAWE